MIVRCSTLATVLVLLVGCSTSGPQIAPVHGRITLNGQPLAKADIKFQPVDAPRPSTARTDEEGRYQLMFKRGQPGAVVGKHTITIWVSREVVPNPPNIAPLPDPNREVKSGDNELNFEVTTEKGPART